MVTEVGELIIASGNYKVWVGSLQPGTDAPRMSGDVQVSKGVALPDLPQMSSGSGGSRFIEPSGCSVVSCRNGRLLVVREVRRENWHATVPE
jgi:hypothetical protein